MTNANPPGDNGWNYLKITKKMGKVKILVIAALMVMTGSAVMAGNKRVDKEPETIKCSATMMVQTGVIKFANHKRGFGFIVDEATGKEYFFLIKNIKTNYKEGMNLENVHVSFDVVEDRKGIMAVHITFI